MSERARASSSSSSFRVGRGRPRRGTRYGENNSARAPRCTTSYEKPALSLSRPSSYTQRPMTPIEPVTVLGPAKMRSAYVETR